MYLVYDIWMYHDIWCLNEWYMMYEWYLMYIWFMLMNLCIIQCFEHQQTNCFVFSFYHLQSQNDLRLVLLFQVPCFPLAGRIHDVILQWTNPVKGLILIFMERHNVLAGKALWWCKVTAWYSVWRHFVLTRVNNFPKILHARSFKTKRLTSQSQSRQPRLLATVQPQYCASGTKWVH